MRKRWVKGNEYTINDPVLVQSIRDEDGNLICEVRYPNFLDGTQNIQDILIDHEKVPLLTDMVKTLSADNRRLQAFRDAVSENYALMTADQLQAAIGALLYGDGL